MRVTRNIGLPGDDEAREAIAEAAANTSFAQVDEDVVIWEDKCYHEETARRGRTGDPQLPPLVPAVPSGSNSCRAEASILAVRRSD